MDTSTAGARREPNRLIHEKSPYLVQHAYDPVNWFPWGPEAFEAARREDKPVFLSVGYSACHWCHVMQRESFENEEIASILNRHYVAVKVDREERPDIDRFYMLVTEAFTGRGGWPNSVWLTPEGKPWFAGTYFPPEDRAGLPGFGRVLLVLADAWREKRQDIEGSADRICRAIAEHEGAKPEGPTPPLDRNLVLAAIEALEDDFDAVHGGFGERPKFPPHNGLLLLLYEYERTRDDTLRDMIALTLGAMAAGGIRDHVGGGFHRYAVDSTWLVPHFEKMLCDNALLLRAYVQAWKLTGDDLHREVAQEISDWLLREMGNSGGGFCTALDADSEGIEGKFYTWTQGEILDVLGPEKGPAFCERYGVEAGGNYRDEATGRLTGLNILHLAAPIESVANARGVPVDEMRDHMRAGLTMLFRRREERTRPRRDDKVLAGWNGLAIGALAYAGAHLGDHRLVEAARGAAEFIMRELHLGGRLRRAWRDGATTLPAYLDDYAFLADGLLDLHDATGDARWLDNARTLAREMIEHHAREAGGFYYAAEDHGTPLLRYGDPFDEAMPSANAIAARVMTRLSEFTGEAAYRERAEATIRAFLPAIAGAPRACGGFVLAAALLLDSPAAAPQPAPGEKPPVPDGAARAQPIAAEVFLQHLRVVPGDRVKFLVRLKVDDGFHVNAHEPRQEYLVPTSLTLEKNPAVTLEWAIYPAPRELRLEWADETLLVYEGTVWLGGELRVAPGTRPGTLALSFAIRSQACTERQCLPPQTLKLPFRLEIAQTSEAERHGDLFRMFWPEKR